MTTLIWTVLALPTGVAAGVLHFRTLRAGTDALILDGALARALGLTALRFAITLAVLIGAARLGTAPLAAAALGVAVGRASELRARSLP